MCDLTRFETLQNAAEWKVQIDQRVVQADKETIPMVLMCNKADLLKEGEEEEDKNHVGDGGRSEGFEEEPDEQPNRKLSVEEEWQTWRYLEDFARRNGFTDMFMTSAKTGEKINETFSSLI